MARKLWPANKVASKLGKPIIKRRPLGVVLARRRSHLDPFGERTVRKYRQANPTLTRIEQGIVNDHWVLLGF